MAESIKQSPSPPTPTKPEGRKTKSNTFKSAEDRERELPVLSEKVQTVERSNPMSLHKDSIPDEIIATLATTVSPLEKLGPPKLTKTPKELRGHGLRSIDAVWHHPVGRKKYKYFLDQPTSLTRAGRDISFLCDTVTADRKVDILPPVREKSTIHKEVDMMNTFIPEEYHIVKNRGVMALEYYEDKYTILLEDEEKRLKLFPSLRPSGRLEAVQLMKVMDEMLDKAGVNQEHPELTDLSQMQGLLELVRVEQNIYNIIFHEVIRQVSVQCMERGLLLSKLRQRYASLLDRIPRQLKGLHTELLAQRALDRHLTQEIVHFKHSMSQLNSELSELKERDGVMCAEVGRAQDELSKTLEESHRSSELVREYHGLYEMQRRRLEDQVAQLTDEKDLWSRVTYSLALKVIEANDLQVASRLHVSEQTWAKVVEHFITLLTAKDTEDMNRILKLTDQWQEHARGFTQKLKEAERGQCEKIRTVAAGIAQWQGLNQANIEDPDKTFDKGSEENLFLDIKQWSALLTTQCERYGGDELLSCQETLRLLSQLQEAWVEVGLQLFMRHPGPEGEVPAGQEDMRQLYEAISEFHEQLSSRVTGENGVYTLFTSVVGMMDHWTTKEKGARSQPEGLSHSDCLKLEQSLGSWMKLIEEAVERVSSGQPEAEKISLECHVRIDVDDTFTMLRKFVFTQGNFFDCENRRLRDEAASLHARMTQWMVDMLLLMVPDLCDDHKSLGADPDARPLSLQNLEQEGTCLAENLKVFSKYLTNSCQAIEEAIMQKAKMQAESEIFELRNLQLECEEWVDACQVLLSNMRSRSVNMCVTMSTDPRAPVTMEPLQPSLTSPPSSTTGEKEPSGEVKVESLEAAEENREEVCVLKMIAHDGSISEKALGERTAPLKGTEEMVTWPETTSAQRAYDALTSLAFLQQQLLAVEERAVSAEERALKSEESLKVALVRIHELEQQLHCGVTLEDNRESATMSPSNMDSPEVSEPNTGSGKSKKKRVKSVKKP